MKLCWIQQLFLKLSECYFHQIRSTNYNKAWGIKLEKCSDLKVKSRPSTTKVCLQNFQCAKPLCSHLLLDLSSRLTSDTLTFLIFYTFITIDLQLDLDVNSFADFIVSTWRENRLTVWHLLNCIVTVLCIVSTTSPVISLLIKQRLHYQRWYYGKELGWSSFDVSALHVKCVK